MAFNGKWLLRVGTDEKKMYIIPLTYMKLESYQSSPDQRQDLDSYRDANGLLHRNVLSHTATKIEFETPYMYNFQMRELLDGIKRNLTDVNARNITLMYYNEETDTYKTGEFYMPGTMTYEHYNKDIYAPCRFAFIEY